MLVTVTSTVSVDSPAGEYAVIDASSLTVKPVAVPPNRTDVAPREVRPGDGHLGAADDAPAFGLSPDTTGAATKVNWSAALVALAPPADVTVTSTVPAGATGETAVIDVELLTVKWAAARVPKLTPVAPPKPVPVSVTLVPPEAGPVVTDIDVSRGAGA